MRFFVLSVVFAAILGQDDESESEASYKGPGFDSVDRKEHMRAMFNKKREAAKFNSYSEKFWKKLGKTPGVMDLVPGLIRYRVLREGYGTQHPISQTLVEADYTATTARLDPDVLRIRDEWKWNAFMTSWGKVFTRSSASRMQPGALPTEGLKISLMKMVEGDHWQVYMHPAVAYGGSPEDVNKTSETEQKTNETEKKEEDDSDDGDNSKKGKDEQAPSPKIHGGDLIVMNLNMARLVQGYVKPKKLCVPKTLKHCSKKEQSYINRTIEKTPEQLEDELEKLEAAELKAVAAAKMEWHDATLVWIKHRIRLARTMLGEEIVIATVIPPLSKEKVNPQTAEDEEDKRLREDFRKEQAEKAEKEKAGEL